jgi:antitoxin component YwqK of YwqJK toxin-antitoxin module
MVTEVVYFKCGTAMVKKYNECNYVNSKLDGLYQLWYDNGQKALESNYVNGVKDGLCQEWYSNGQKASENTYVNGVLPLLPQSKN